MKPPRPAMSVVFPSLALAVLLLLSGAQDVAAAPATGGPDAVAAAAAVGPRVAFDSYVEGANGRSSRRIFVIGVDGGEPQRVTGDEIDESTPDWSPDGQLLAFARFGDIATVRPDGTDLMVIAHDGSDGYPDWSPDGRQIAFRGSDGVYVAGRDGSGLRRVSDVLYAKDVAWSPDGTRIAFEQYWPRDFDYVESDVYVVALATGVTTRITADRRSGLSGWSPDGSRLSFASAGDLLTSDPDGGDQRILARGASGGYWSPDGARVAFVDRASDRPAVIDAGGAEARRLLSEEVVGATPIAWLPDGRSFALVDVRPGADAGSRGGLYLVDADDGSARRLTGLSLVTNPDVSPTPPFVERLAGEGRVATALELSRRTFPCVEGDRCARSVLIARADDPADALSGTPLAVALDAPVLLTGGDRLDARVAAEVARLGAEEAVLLGGAKALSTAVARELEDVGVSRVRRLAGPTRFATAAAVADELDPATVYLASASGGGWADALSAGALAGSTGGAVLLVEREELPAATAEALSALAPTRVYLLGGRAAVTAEVEEEVDDFVDEVVRVAGATRYDTAVLAADQAVRDGADPATAWVASGRDWPDALSAGAAAANVGGVRRLRMSEGCCS